MKLIKAKNGIKYLWLEHLWRESSMLIIFSSRLGGFSQPPYNSLNLAFHVGDKKNIVMQNRRHLCKTLNVSLRDIVFLNQVHGTDYHIAEEKDKGKGAVNKSTAMDGDAIILNSKDIGSALFFADCVPISIVEPKLKVVASIHAGWKGTLNNICQKIIKALITRLNCNPFNLKAYIWPSIRGCCYRVGSGRYNTFLEKFPAPKKDFKSGAIDLALINRHEILKTGVKPANIFISEYCTSCQKDLFYSYRAENGKTGRQSLMSYIY